jgi:hypothetical protein
MAELGVVLKSSEVKQSILQQYHPDNWDAFEQAVENTLKQQFAGAHVQSVRTDIAASAHPGPLLLKFTVISQTQITAQQLKDALRR